MDEKKTPTKRKSHGRVPQAYGTIDPEFSRKVMRCNMEIMNIRVDKPKTVEEMRETVAAFFEICDKYAMIPTVEGLCLATKYERNSLFDIENGKGRSDFSNIVKNAKEYIKMYDVAMAANGMMPASVYQFRAKNFYGMKDVQEVTVAPKTDLEPETASEILQEIPDQLQSGETN